MTLDIAAIVRAEIAKFLKTSDAPATPAPKKPVSDDIRSKRLAALEKARAAKKAKGKAKPAAAPAKAATKPVSVPKRDTLDPVQGKRLIAEAYVSAKGVKSIMLGNGAKQGRLVFHDRAELVEWINEVRVQLGVDAVALADLHFGG